MGFKTYVVFLAILLFLVVFPSSAGLTVHFLDVGEGDAVLLQSDEKSMLIDSGTRDSGNLTLAYLDSLNISSLDSVMVTGPAEGRTGALLSILNNTAVGEFLCGGWNSTEPSYIDVLNRIKVNNTPITILSPGDHIPFTHEISIDLLSPGNKTWVTPTDTLIPLVSCGNVSFLLMGDDPIVSGTITAQIIRVADHGSRKGTDSWFLNKIRPEVAVISTGQNNNGNPDTSTLSLLENNGASILRTDRDGIITVTTNGKGYTVGKLRMEPELTISLVSVVETRAPTGS